MTAAEFLAAATKAANRARHAVVLAEEAVERAKTANAGGAQ